MSKIFDMGGIMVAGAQRPDDERVRMTAVERTVWASLVAVALSSGGYVALVAPRLLSQPVEEISWVAPMLWAMGLGVAGSVLLSTVFAAAAAVRPGEECSPAAHGEVTSDVRDQEIGRHGAGISLSVISAGAAGALVLAMLDVHTFWIGNLLFLAGTVTAVVEAGAKIRLYRRGF
jgi:hypothetical protein